MAKKTKRVSKKTARPKKGIKTKGSPLAAAQRKIKSLARSFNREITRLELENDSLREQNADLSAQLDEALCAQDTPGNTDGEPEVSED